MQPEYYMQRALSLAAKGAGAVDPNPMVGAVIVKNGQIAGEGWHKHYGGPHAEIEALKNCSPRNVQGSTIYVTLEPCCHHGRTPPCTQALIQSGIKQAVIGISDPNSLVAGKGIQALREQGIQVTLGVCEEECRQLNQVFFHYIQERTPFVVMKYAMTADGKLATARGDSQWITSNQSRQHTHSLRHRLRGIMIGSGTALRDDPLLTCRLPGGRNPIRIICDSQLSLPLTSQLVKTAGEYPTIIATTSPDAEKRKILEEAGIKILVTPPKDGRVDLGQLMAQLGAAEINSLLLEGGGNLNFSALKENIVQKLMVYVGAKLFGGAQSLSPVEGPGVDAVSQAFPLKLEKITQIDQDVLLEYGLEAQQCSQA